ncbi:MAG: hypothetical protein IKU30_08525 [Clostridia bacterium]|nr:hypothetical protein [Clostridia bacterium]
MKKIVVFFLLIALSLVSFVACQTEEVGTTDETSSQSATSTEVSEESNGLYVPSHEVKDQGGRTFTIIVIGGEGTYVSDDFTTESHMYGELIDEAVQKRNDMVEKLYNVQLEVVKSATINNDIVTDCQSSLGTYDAIMPSLKYLSTLASQEYLYELTEINGFDINAPWYDKNCTEAFSINNKVFFTSGDITILNKVNTPSVLFNKEMAKKYYPEVDFYQLVRDEEWTFDKLVEFAKGVANISTTDGTYSDDNQYGMVTAYGDPVVFFGGSGEKFVRKDSEDIPYLSFGSNERSITLAQKVLETYKDANWLIHAQLCEAPVWETSFAVFYEGRALFRPSYFSATTKLRKLSEIEFGVLPVPMMDDTQDSYYSYCGTGATAGVAIPICAKDPEFSAYMIDAYSAWAKNYLTPAYYEINLRYKDLRDDESEEMLDIIFDNIVYDMGECFSFGDVATILFDQVKAGNSDVVSIFETRKPQAEAEIEQLIATYVD